MKTIAQHVKEGISTLEDLKDALQTAMQLEFSTLPPYLCAQWSINGSNNGDPSDVSDMIGDVCIEEMYHFALAGNMLTAIGGTPAVANADFVPSYPTNVLPGGIPQKLAVDLLPLSPEQLLVFMQIEMPAFPPVALTAAEGPATIGAFYDTIAAGFATVNPTFVSNAPYVEVPNAGSITNNGQITNVADAQAAIERIKMEGEGTEGSPDQPPDDQDTFAHYYEFKEISQGKTLQQVDGQWGFTGDPITFPSVYNFAPSGSTTEFNQKLTTLLTNLQNCWTQGGAVPYDDMNDLQTLGTGLIQQGTRPEFKWAQS